MKIFQGSYRTTIYGAAAFLTSLCAAVMALTDGNPQTNPEWSVVVTAGMTFVALLQARDNKVTSEEAMKKPKTTDEHR